MFQPKRWNRGDQTEVRWPTLGSYQKRRVVVRGALSWSLIMNTKQVILILSTDSSVARVCFIWTRCGTSRICELGDLCEELVLSYARPELEPLIEEKVESLDLEVPTEAAPYATVPSKAEIT